MRGRVKREKLPTVILLIITPYIFLVSEPGEVQCGVKKQEKDEEVNQRSGATQVTG